MHPADPLPPWMLDPGTPYRAYSLECNRPYVRSTWRPFWDALTDDRRAAYLDRFPPAPDWQRFLEDVALDREMARIDAEDIASGVLQPNGLAWPEPQVVRPPLWRRLLRRCRGRRGR